MILGFETFEIIELANDHHSEITDGVVQYDYTTQEIHGAAFTTGTIENPENPFIELIRLPQGERGEIDCKCYETGECPFYQNGAFNENMIDEYGNKRIQCCIDGYIEDNIDDIKENIEKQIIEVLHSHLGNILSILNDIRIEINDKLNPHEYIKVRQEDWELNILDSYVDAAMDFGFDINVEPADYVDAEIQYLSGICEFQHDPYWNLISHRLDNHKFNEVLDMLMNDKTNIQISRYVKERLVEISSKTTDTYNDVILKLLDVYDEVKE